MPPKCRLWSESGALVYDLGGDRFCDPGLQLIVLSEHRRIYEVRIDEGCQEPLNSGMDNRRVVNEMEALEPRTTKGTIDQTTSPRVALFLVGLESTRNT
jgi:hypothetical protein